MADSRRFAVTIAGRSMLMRNAQLADPLNAWSKALKAETSKRKKSDTDHEKIAEIEFQGGLYFDEKAGPYIPGSMLDACISAGARKNKLGKVFESCVRASDDLYALSYKGPRTRAGLWSDPSYRDRRSCGMNAARVIRTRPKFDDWSVSLELTVFPCELNPTDLEEALRNAGAFCGIGDFRPRFGLFTVEGFKEIS